MRVDLSDYPDYFYEDGEFDTFIIYSEYEDVTKYYAEELAEKFNTDMIYSSNEDHYWIKSPKHYRIISLGSPCVNAVSARLKDNPEQCNEDLQENMGKITLLENNGYPQMIIEGHDDYMRLHALKVLLDMDDSLLKGTEWEVTSSDSSSLSVEKLNDKKVTLGDCDSGGSSGGGDGSSGGGSPGPVCYSGCRSNGNCLEFGTRMVNAKTKAPVYCELDKLFKDQKQIGEVCQNNYECLSNSCYGGECTDLAGQIEETNSLIRQIFNWLKYLFSLN